MKPAGSEMEESRARVGRRVPWAGAGSGRAGFRGRGRGRGRAAAGTGGACSRAARRRRAGTAGGSAYVLGAFSCVGSAPGECRRPLPPKHPGSLTTQPGERDVWHVPACGSSASESGRRGCGAGKMLSGQGQALSGEGTPGGLRAPLRSHQPCPRLHPPEKSRRRAPAAFPGEERNCLETLAGPLRAGSSGRGCCEDHFGWESRSGRPGGPARASGARLRLAAVSLARSTRATPFPGLPPRLPGRCRCRGHLLLPDAPGGRCLVPAAGPRAELRAAPALRASPPAPHAHRVRIPPPGTPGRQGCPKPGGRGGGCVHPSPHQLPRGVF